MRKFLFVTAVGVLMFYLGGAFQEKRDAMALLQASQALRAAQNHINVATEKAEDALAYAEGFEDRCIEAFNKRNIYHEPPVMSLAESMRGHGYDVLAIRQLICGR